MKIKLINKFLLLFNYILLVSPSNEADYANRFLMSKNLINTETLLLNELVLDYNNATTSNSIPNNTPTEVFLVVNANNNNNNGIHQQRQQLGSNSLSLSRSNLNHSTSASNLMGLKMQKYKLFVEQTDQVGFAFYKPNCSHIFL